MYVDSHCHLSDPALLARMPDVRRDMAAAQVDRALCICTTLEEFPQVHALALAHDNFWCSVGVHPDNEDVQEPQLDDLLQRAALPRVVAIGETGLDYYRLNGRSIDDMAWQRDRFAVHIQAARRTGLPLVVHTRSASADTVDMLRSEGRGASGGNGGAGRKGSYHGNGSETAVTLPDARGVFHCFTETREVARAALDLGFLISFSGILTFKNAEELREVARMVPLDRCLIETDSPYLAPMPYRGKLNQPAYVPWVAAKLAELKGISQTEVARATSANFEGLFGIPPLQTMLQTT